jgi:hypothetical protein
MESDDTPAAQSEPAYPAFDKMSSAELLEYAVDIDKAHKKHMTYIRALAKAKAGLE